MCGPTYSSWEEHEGLKSTCQFCSAEFDNLEDLYRHVKTCKPAIKCRKQVEIYDMNKD